MSLADLDVEAKQQVEDLRQTVRRLQTQLAKAKAKVDDLVDATIAAATDATRALGPLQPTKAPKLSQSDRRPEVALLDTGDWQYAKVTPSYNSDIADRRVRQFFTKSIELVDLYRQAVPVRDAVVVFGGDMGEGISFQFPTQPFEIDATLFDQFIRVSRLMVDVVKQALASFDKVTVVPEWGNHGRIGSRRDAVPRSDNLDRMAYEMARQLLEDETRLTWQKCPEDIQRLEVGNYRALVLHGDEVGRGGIAAPGTFAQHMNRWKAGAYRVDGEPWPFRDVYTHHFHNHYEHPLADGEGAVYQTGSTESDNRYASIGMAATSLPSQRLHFISPDKGVVTAQYKVRLD